MTEESIVTGLWRAIRWLLLLAVSFCAAFGAFYSALEGQWNRGIFFLLVMIVSDRVFDRAYESFKKREEERAKQDENNGN